MNYIDIHTHSKTWLTGVTKVVNLFPWDNVGIDEGDDRIITAGIHPWFIDEVDIEVALQQIETWIRLGVVKGVGETGLDRIKGPKESVQESVFEEHIRMSEKYHCPLTVHCVRRYNETVGIRKRMNAKQPWILHGFNSSLQMMEQMVNVGIHISLGLQLLKNNDKLKEVCRLIPPEYLFLETDDSNIAIEEIYQKVAGIRSITVDELKEITDNNFRSLGFIDNCPDRQ